MDSVVEFYNRWRKLVYNSELPVACNPEGSILYPSEDYKTTSAAAQNTVHATINHKDSDSVSSQHGDL